MLITGGGSGIGAALAHRLHDAGNRVIIARRRMEVLVKVVAGRDRMYAVALDVEDAGSIVEMVAKVVSDYPSLNVLVNNAGIMRDEVVDQPRDLADAEATIATNLLGPIRLIDALIAHLMAQSDAAIVNVCWGLAFVPFATSPTYSATKAAIHSYTVALREALKDKVEVIELVPPGVQTALTPGQETRPGYMPLDAFIDETMALLNQQPTPAEVLVERVRPLRLAEAEGRFGQIVTMLHDAAQKAAAQN